MAISNKPSESSLSGAVRSESDLYFLGQHLEECTDRFERAAYALYSIAYYYPFFEGNKRAALLTCELLLDGLLIDADTESVYRMVLDVACGRMEPESITAWLKDNTSLSEE